MIVYHDRSMHTLLFLIVIGIGFSFTTCIKKKEQSQEPTVSLQKNATARNLVSQEIKGLINEPGVKVREEASNDAKIIMQLDVGSRVEVIEVYNEWYKVAIANSDKVGWIKKSKVMEFAQWIAFNNQHEEIKQGVVTTDEIIFSNFLILPMSNKDKYANAGELYQAILETLISNARFKIMSTNVAFAVEKQFKTKESLEIPSDILQKIALEENVDGIINGKISKTDSKKGTKWDVVIHVYQAKKGVLHSIEKTVIYEPDDDPKKVIEDLVLGMINRLPYFAVIESVTGDHITINQGKNVQLLPFQTLPIFRATHIIRDPQNGTFVECDTVKIGTLRIEKLFDRSAEGIIEEKVEDALVGFLIGPPVLVSPQ